jgi:hypothetical protein
MSMKTLLPLLAATAAVVVSSQTLLPTQSAHAKDNQPEASVVATNLVSALALKAPSAFRFNESFGWVTGSDTSGLVIE